ncbi:hypothetical protein BDM02DRAFT_3194010 [Thelephora ganbajun]|uniref:Uncharacterized protein n=1 Tax=Thelephora ganbajun TaxID=370292 RepID=A0ACB6YYA5_THEGA|nr:hypothetical protein BDM02DRAFT_3194010 [Thelephora ganbajun]
MSSFSILSSSPANTSPRRRALIADERSSFFRSWNTTTIAHARGSRHHPYPPPSSVFTRANTAENSDEDFSDLAVNDFVLSHKVTTRQKLERLQGSVFTRSLLERGTFHAMEGIEVYNGPIEVSMGYTASVGVMLAEEIALTNDVVGAVSVTTRGTVARVSELEDTVRGLETIVRRLKRSHESLRIYTEMELANRDLTIGLLRACLNTIAPMEIDLTTEEEEYISAPGTPPTSGNTSTTNISIRIETPELVVLEGVLIPIEDSSEDEDGEGEVVVPNEIEALELLGIVLPLNTFNWQDECAQGREEYYRRQREEEERAREEPEYVPPPLYDDIFPDVIAADRLRHSPGSCRMRFRTVHSSPAWERSVISPLTIDGEGARCSNIESLVLCNGDLDVSELLTRYHFPELRHLNLDRLKLHVAALTTLSFAISHTSATPTASQLLSILTSYPNPQEPSLREGVIPRDVGDGSTFRYLEKPYLIGDCCHVFWSPHRPEYPGTLGQVWLDDQFRSRLGIQIPSTSRYIEFEIEAKISTMLPGHSQPSLPCRALFRDQPQSTEEQLSINFIALTPRDHVIDFAGGLSMHT